MCDPALACACVTLVESIPCLCARHLPLSLQKFNILSASVALFRCPVVGAVWQVFAEKHGLLVKMLISSSQLDKMHRLDRRVTQCLNDMRVCAYSVWSCSSVEHGCVRGGMCLRHVHESYVPGCVWGGGLLACLLVPACSLPTVAPPRPPCASAVSCCCTFVRWHCP
jgi:hypothetical protein